MLKSSDMCKNLHKLYDFNSNIPNLLEEFGNSKSFKTKKDAFFYSIIVIEIIIIIIIIITISITMKIKIILISSLVVVVVIRVVTTYGFIYLLK